MKKKLYLVCILIIILLFSNAIPVFADSIKNNGVQFIGEVKTTKKYYDGDVLLKSDINIDGHCIDSNGNILSNEQIYILTPEYADINLHEYKINDKKNIRNSCTGNINIDIIPFDPTVNYEPFEVKPMEYFEGDDLNIIKGTASYNLGLSLKNTKFTNNLGKELKSDYNPIIDTTNLSNTVGEYDVPYIINFYGNSKFKYNQVKGSFKVIVNAKVNNETSLTANTVVKVTEEIANPSLTASTLILSPETSFDINLVDKPSSATYSWKSSNTNVATVNKSGIVTAKSNGTAKISCLVTTPDNKKQTLTTDVIVGLDDDNLPCLSENELSLEVGDLFDIDVSNLISGSKVKFVSSDKLIASVTSSTGKVTTFKNGTCVITCTITTKNKDVYVLKCNVIVE